MKAEPRSHKKATAVFVAVLLLVYVGSYLWMRKHRDSISTKNYRVLNPPFLQDSAALRRAYDILFWPLRTLDRSLTGKVVGFTLESVYGYGREGNPKVDWSNIVPFR